jgi:hypothetical protein
MVIFLDLVDDGSLFDLHVVLRGLVAFVYVWVYGGDLAVVVVCVHDLIGTMRHLMLILLLETRLLRQKCVMLQACETFFAAFSSSLQIALAVLSLRSFSKSIFSLTSTSS